MKTEVACYRQDCAFHEGEFECTSDLVVIGHTLECLSFVGDWEDNQQTANNSATNLPKS